MSRFKFLFAALVPLLIKGQVPFISLTTTPIDVITGGVVCPTFVEVTCVGIEVDFLEWLRNGFSIRAFTSNSNEGMMFQQGAFKFFLDSIVRSDGLTLNMTSRLVVNVSDLISGDRITCTENRGAGIEDTIMLEYMLRGSPPAVPTNFSVFIESDSTTVNISITWDSAFNLVHNVTSYRVVASGGSAASCPLSCDPSSPCKCTRLGIGEDISIMISAINCGDQMGPPVMIMARPQVPSMPLGCVSLPVYTLAGDLSAVNLMWTTVTNPPEFLPEVSQNVTHYSVMVDMIDSMTVSASTACPTSACSYTYSLQSLSLPNSPLTVSVSAGNVIGRGQMCTPQTQIDSRNQIFILTLDTTNTDNQTVACTQLSSRVTGTFQCEFCYGVGVSCQNLTTCVSSNGSTTLLPNLTELTYCYRATASINGSTVAVIQDTFNTVCPVDVLGNALDNQTNPRCSSDSVGSISIPNGVGCYNGQRSGSMTSYQCDKWYRLSQRNQRTCGSDGNWDGEVPNCGLNGANIALLVLSILSWIASAILTVVGVVAIKKNILCKLTSFRILALWSKVTYIVFLAIEILLLLIVLVLWIAFGVILQSPNSDSQQTSLLIAAFLLALPWIIIALIFVCMAPKCSNDEVPPETGIKMTSRVSPEPEYAVPHKKGPKPHAPEEGDDHRSGPNNKPKSKGFTVNKKKTKKQISESNELPPYDVLEGPGRHHDQPNPRSHGTVNTKNYDALDVGDPYSVPYEPKHDHSEKNKRSSQKRLLA